MADRYVKLGRKPLSVGVGHHWAVKVEDKDGDGYWYEIAGASKGDTDSPNVINKSKGFEAASTAGRFGGEIVGKTTKSDDDIEAFNKSWLSNNKTYQITGDNCQKFGIEFIAWLTDDNYRLNHILDAGSPKDKYNSRTLAVAHGGQAYASACAFDVSGGEGLLQVRVRGPTAEAEAVAGPGLYAGANGSLLRTEFNLANVAGAHIDLNLNTGAGIRGGNAEASLLGFGAKIGTDGLEINTPIMGARLPWVGAPINWIGNLFR